MTYPAAVRAIAADAPLLRVTSEVSWQELAQKHSVFEEQDRATIEARQMADRISHEFAGDVLKRMSIETYETERGRKRKFVCCALRYDQLMELLYRAYREGQTDGMRRPVPEVL